MPLQKVRRLRSPADTHITLCRRSVRAKPYPTSVTCARRPEIQSPTLIACATPSPRADRMIGAYLSIRKKLCLGFLIIGLQLTINYEVIRLNAVYVEQQPLRRFTLARNPTPPHGHLHPRDAHAKSQACAWGWWNSLRAVRLRPNARFSHYHTRGASSATAPLADDSELESDWGDESEDEEQTPMTMGNMYYRDGLIIDIDEGSNDDDLATELGVDRSGDELSEE
ncbi:hypothetical protein C8J57DRAFT_1672383 [Mycena rebaudengoi]|nr:hypothetical protein C8J57DRAFT_1672383 [Mycena rebaudengoi]